MNEIIIRLLEVIQVLLPTYAMYKIIVERYKYWIISMYSIWFVLFSLLKLRIIVPEYWTLMGAILWGTANIFFFIFVIILINLRKYDWIHRSN